MIATKRATAFIAQRGSSLYVWSDGPQLMRVATARPVAIEFESFDGPAFTVKGHFDRYEGTLNLEERPALELTIHADSLETKHGKRDAHLRSGEFFDVANHQHIRFVADTVTVQEATLSARGELHAAGRQVPLNVEATVRQVEGEFEVEAIALVDHRELGMTWSPLGILRAPSKLIVRGRLINKEVAQ